MKQQELSFVASGNSKWYSHFRRQFGGFYKTKGILTIQSSNCTPWYFPKGVENLVYIETCTNRFIEALFVIAKMLSNQDVLA